MPTYFRGLPSFTRIIMKVLRRMRQRKEVHPLPVSPFPPAAFWSYEEAQNSTNEKAERYRAEGGAVLTLPFCYVEWAV